MKNLFGGWVKGRAAPGWLAVELDEAAVALAHVRPVGARMTVEFAEEREWDPAEPKSLERVAREFGAQRFRCTTLLAPAHYQILLVDAPAVKREELKPALRWRIKDMIDYHVDDATLDVLDLPLPPGPGARTPQMYAIAARTSVIRGTIERLENAGIPLSVIDIPDTAQRNLAAHYEAPQRGVVALTFDRHGGLITVNFSGELYLTRRLDITEAQLAEAEPEEYARLAERVLVEMQRSFDHCERSFPFFSLSRAMVGPIAGDTSLREHLASHLYLPVEPLELGEVVDLPAEAAAWSDEQSARWLKRIGAGMRVEKRAL